MKPSKLTLETLTEWWKTATSRQKDMAVVIHVMGLCPPTVGSSKQSIHRDDTIESFSPWKENRGGVLTCDGEFVDLDSRSSQTWKEYWAPSYSENLKLAYHAQNKAVRISGEDCFALHMAGVLGIPAPNLLGRPIRSFGYTGRDLCAISTASADERAHACVAAVLATKRLAP